MDRRIRVLTLAVTNQCPLSCAHCGPMSGPREHGHLDMDAIVSVLDTAAARNCLVVNFSGGEPFLLKGVLLEMVNAVAIRSMIPRVTTGAYWSKTPEQAHGRLEPLARAGLKQLIVSFSDGHKEFLPTENMLLATRAARSLGIQVVISVVKSRSGMNARYIRSVFESANIPIPPIYENPLIPFGRAADGPAAKSAPCHTPVENLSGGCPSVTEQPAVHADGTVSGCAVVFARDSAAHQYGNLSDSSFETILEKMNSHPLSTWIHHFGVVALKDLIEGNSDIRFATHYVNICHLCGDILKNERALECLADMGFEPPGYKSNQLMANQRVPPQD